MGIDNEPAGAVGEPAISVCTGSRRRWTTPRVILSEVLQRVASPYNKTFIADVKGGGTASGDGIAS